jgi:hypothetical protein
MWELPYVINKLIEQLVHLLGFQAYINEMQGSVSKIKNVSDNVVDQVNILRSKTFSPPKIVPVMG